MTTRKPDIQYINFNAPPPGNTHSHASRIAVGNGYIINLSGHQGKDEGDNFIPLDDDGSQRIRQAFRNLKHSIELIGGNLRSVFKLQIITPLPIYRNVINKIQKEEEFYGDGPVPPRTILYANLPEDDICEISADIYIKSHRIERPRMEQKSHISKRNNLHKSRQQIVEPREEYSEESLESEHDYEESDNEYEEEKVILRPKERIVEAIPIKSKSRRNREK